MKTNIAFLLCLILTFGLSAQKDPIKWGKVNSADLKMKVYDLDKEAEAVVLTDYGTLDFDFSIGAPLYTFDHHVRIKILKKSAFDRGDISIPYYAYNKSERITNLKAQVILPSGKKLTVSKKDIFDEKRNEYWSLKKIAMPGLEEGCIIEYKYTKRSNQIYYLEDWYFQSDIPTRLSEFRTNIPEWFDYISFTQGDSPQVEKKSGPGTFPVSEKRSSISSGGVATAEVNKIRYYLENVPALRSEKFITTMRDYYSKVSLQLQYINFPNSIGQEVTGNWEKVAKDLAENPLFGEQLDKKRHTRHLMAAVNPTLEGITDTVEKVNAIYSFINKNVQWDKLYGIFSNSLDGAFEEKRASSGELNMMLVALCRQLDIEAYPVLISTRNHGKTMQYYPKLDQFNHVLAFVQIGETQQLFDIGSPNRDPGLLRMNSLNYSGWLVDGEKSQWVAIPASSDSEVALATLKLEENGNLSGTINQSFKGYCAMDARNNFHKNKNEDHKHVREDWQNRFPDATIKSVGFQNEHQVTEALKCDLELDIPQAAQINDDFIYLSPMLGMGYDENPLKQEERTFPVDIPIKSKDQYVLNLTIPDGYVVEELPDPINLKMDGNAGRFQFRVSQTGTTIQVISKVIITKLHYEPKEYNVIKNFFDIIVEKHGEQIVLKRD